MCTDNHAQISNYAMKRGFKNTWKKNPQQNPKHNKLINLLSYKLQKWYQRINKSSRPYKLAMKHT